MVNYLKQSLFISFAEYHSRTREHVQLQTGTLPGITLCLYENTGHFQSCCSATQHTMCYYGKISSIYFTGWLTIMGNFLYYSNHTITSLFLKSFMENATTEATSTVHTPSTAQHTHPAQHSTAQPHRYGSARSSEVALPGQPSPRCASPSSQPALQPQQTTM